MQLDFEKGEGLLPVIVQDAETRAVLMLGYCNEAAWKHSLESGKMTFYSRSKQRLWTKGETSGNHLVLVDWKADCDRDTILVWARPTGPICHTGADTCFGTANKARFDLHTLDRYIRQRATNPVEGSYTNHLLDKGINKVAQKVGEEAVELVIEAKDDNRDLFLGEAADLLYHYLVLLTAKGYALDDVLTVLEKRHKS